MFQLYQTSLGENGQLVAGAVEVLKQTSVLVELFNDLRPFKGLDDVRLSEMKEVLSWLDSWGREEKKQSKLSYQTQEDVTSMLTGLTYLVEQNLKAKQGAAIVPGRVNSDLVENIFCQQRTLINGAKTNPTAQDYGIGVNAILCMQVPVSRKRNACTSQPQGRKTLKMLKEN